MASKNQARCELFLERMLQVANTANYFDSLDKQRLTRQSIRRLEALGYAVSLIPKQEVVA